MDSLVRIFPNALSVKECDELVAKFEASPSLQRKQAEGEMSFTQIDFLEHSKVFAQEQAVVLNNSFPYIEQYKKDTNAHFPPKYSFEAVRMKKYEANGVDQFGNHIDATSLANSRRWLVFFYYLDDNKEGATVIEPHGHIDALGFEDVIHSPCNKGTLIIFPVGFAWPHRGEKPVEKPKYIVGSYLHYV